MFIGLKCSLIIVIFSLISEHCIKQSPAAESGERYTFYYEPYSNHSPYRAQLSSSNHGSQRDHDPYYEQITGHAYYDDKSAYDEYMKMKAKESRSKCLGMGGAKQSIFSALFSGLTSFFTWEHTASVEKKRRSCVF